MVDGTLKCIFIAWDATFLQLDRISLNCNVYDKEKYLLILYMYTKCVINVCVCTYYTLYIYIYILCNLFIPASLIYELF